MAHIKDFEHLKIRLEDIKSATNNFADESCIGKGGFGKVYKGEIVGHKIVAFKRLVSLYGQGNVEFWKEIMMLSLYKHKNIVSLLGYCDDMGERILAYEYAPKRSLDLYLNSTELTWVRRLNICIGAAHGLAYLHGAVGTQQRLLHRDIKSSNVLLNDDWNPKLSDFGLSKLGPANQKYTFIYSNAVGTLGYCDPLYAETGLLTKESDVYSFGVVLFEVLCGRLCFDKNNKRKSLIGLARQYYEENMIDDLIYSNIKNEINRDSLNVFTRIAYQCLKRDREERPSMTDIVRALETALQFQRYDLKKGANERKIFDDVDTKKVNEGPITVNLKLSLHCETCAKKIIKYIQNCKGVETVKADLVDNMLTIVGKVDPVHIKERVEYKTNKKVELLSPRYEDDVAIKDDDKASEEYVYNQKSKEKEVEKKEAKGKIFDAHDKKKVDDGRITVLLKIGLHCKICAEMITKSIQKFEGVEIVKAYLATNTLSIIGKVNPIKIKERVEYKTKRKVEILFPKLEKDDEVVKKDDELKPKEGH